MLSLKEKTLGPKSKKSVTYMRRMITSGKWAAYSRIPSLIKIADNLGVSIATVRKAVTVLENDRLIENNGYLGFTVIPIKLSQLFTSNKNLFYIKMAERKIKAVELLENGGIPIGDFIVQSRKNNILYVYHTLKNQAIITSLEEIKEAAYSPIVLNDMLGMNGDEMRKAKAKYRRQQILRKIANPVMRRRKEIGV